MIVPTRSKVFYGWWVVAAAVLCIVFGYSSLVSVAFGLFTTDLEAAFGWTRVQTSFAATLATGSIVVLAPIVGVLVDRFGARRVLLPSLALLGVAVAALSQLNGSLTQFYALIVLFAVCGMGTQPPVFSRIVVSWFDRHRGLALGVALSGVGLADIVLPWFLQPIIADYGWRTGYVTVGLLLICLVLPIAYFVIRDTPASLGLAPDGADATTDAAAATRAEQAQGLQLREALRDRAMWQMLVAFGLMGIVSAGFFIHLAPMLKGRGFGMSEVATTLALKGAAVICGRIICGALVDRFFAPYVAGAFIAAPALGLALIAGADSMLPIAVGTVLIGLGLGAEFDLMAYLISRYIGFRTYGRVYGITYAAFGVGGAIGPIAMGYGFTHFGSYGPGLAMLAVAPVVAALLLTLLGPYRYASHRGARQHARPLPAAQSLEEQA